MLGLRVVEPLNAPRERLVWGVAALVHAVSDALTARFSVCAVRGEIVGFSRAASGHCYFSLQDAEGQQALVRCAMFRRAASLLDFAPSEGQLVELRGRLTLYEPRGELQLVVESMQRAGAGALFERFLRLKAQLAAEGLFDAERKKPLPAFAQCVGVVTSLGAAALHDVLTALARRAPQVRVVVYPSLVQGSEAPAALVQAMARAEQRQEVDVLIVCRGGGSLEDLWAFNDERVVRAMASCTLPVVCGVGHETDVSLADFAADVRAPTPTAAAELVAPTQQSCLDALDGLARRARSRVHQQLDQCAQRLDRATHRLARPRDGLRGHGQRLALLAQRLSGSVQAYPVRQAQRLQVLQARLGQGGRVLVRSQAQHLAALQARLQALDPKQVLQRGYAWLSDERGQPITSVAALALGMPIQAVLADGQARANVTEVLRLTPTSPPPTTSPRT